MVTVVVTVGSLWVSELVGLVELWMVFQVRGGHESLARVSASCNAVILVERIDQDGFDWEEGVALWF